MKFRYKKPTPAEVPVITAQGSLQSKQRGSFSIDENVPLKMNSLFFKLYHVYFSSHAENVSRKQIFLESISWGSHSQV